jgi:Sulfotransferase domain
VASTIQPRLPDFIGIGPNRTGTTWLHQVLEGHVDLPHGVKETEFFNTFYSKGIEWYACHFRHAAGDRKVAEICPYLSNPEAAERIKRHIPDCKFIVTLRNPVDRAYSYYKLMVRYAWVRGTFEEVLRTRPHIDVDSRCAEYLAAWFEQFGRERFLIARYEELRSDPQGYLDRICDFTGTGRIRIADRAGVKNAVNSYERAPKSRKLAQNARHLIYRLREHQAYGVINALERAGVWEFCAGRGKIFPSLSSAQKAVLTERYLPEVEALERLLEIDLSDWKKPRAARLDNHSGLPR